MNYTCEGVAVDRGEDTSSAIMAREELMDSSGASSNSQVRNVYRFIPQSGINVLISSTIYEVLKHI